MQKCKLIALDIDGVLNSTEFSKYLYENNKQKSILSLAELDPNCVRRLNEIIMETTEEDSCPTKILLSSTWRLDFATTLGINMFFEARGIIPVCIGKTNYLQLRRGYEILDWIFRHQYIYREYEVNNLVILDDDSDMEMLTPWWVHTPNMVGLQDKAKEKAIDILNNKKFELKVNL